MCSAVLFSIELPSNSRIEQRQAGFRISVTCIIASLFSAIPLIVVVEVALFAFQGYAKLCRPGDNELNHSATYL